MERKRMNEWDFIKGVLIVFVIWGHCCAYLSGLRYEKNLLTTYIRLFQMPLFILVSGYFQKPVYTIRELIEKYKKSIINIAVPYVIWTCIYYAFMLISKHLMGEEISFSILEVIKSFSFLWFLGCILICQFVFNTLSFIWHRNRSLGIALLSCSLICFLLIGGGYLNSFHFPFLWPFYIVGYGLRKFDIMSCSQKRCVRFSVFLMSLFVLIVGYSFKTEWTFYNRLNCISEYGIRDLVFVIGRYMLYFATTFSALFVLITLYIKTSEMKLNHLIVNSGRDTLFLYAAHVTILFNTLKPVINIMTNGNGILVGYPFARYYVVATIITFIVLGVLENIYRILSNYKCTSILILGRSKS